MFDFAGLVMAVVIVFSNKVSINPDNVATPIAASLGDVSTAAIFAVCAEWIHSGTLARGDGFPFGSVATIAAFAFTFPVFYAIARQSKWTRNLIHSGWTPIISAMVISSGGGLFL